jgi:hypothetical protein
MKLTHLLTILTLAIAVPIHAQEPVDPVTTSLQEEEAPVGGIKYESQIEEITILPVTIIGRMLEGDIATIPTDIEKISSFVQKSKMSTEQKEQVQKSLDTMSYFFSPENGGSVGPVQFLLATNEVFNELNDYKYKQEEQTVPAYMYQLQYMARKLQFQVLEKNWKEIEEHTADDITDLVSDIYRNLEDPTVWQNAIRPINDDLRNGVDSKDTTLVYGAGQAYLSAAPLIETATMKKIEQEQKVEAEKKKNNTTIAFAIIGALVLLGLLLFIRRRMS